MYRDVPEFEACRIHPWAVAYTCAHSSSGVWGVKREGTDVLRWSFIVPTQQRAWLWSSDGSAILWTQRMGYLGGKHSLEHESAELRWFSILIAGIRTPPSCDRPEDLPREGARLPPRIAGYPQDYLRK